MTAVQDGDALGAALEQLAERIRTTRRKRSPVEAPVGLTGAYTSLQFAYGFARARQPERARALVAETRAALAPVLGDPVHAYLAAAFEARVEQAIAGLPPETPLPEPLRAQYAALDNVARFKVDRLREVSQTLEPVERLDAISAFSRRVEDVRGPELAALRAMADPDARAKEVVRLFGIAANSNDFDRTCLLDGCFATMHTLPESHAIPLLVTAIPLIERLPEPSRAVAYAGVLGVAGHFGRTEPIPRLLAALGAAIRAAPVEVLERVLDKSLRALRRIGLRDEMAELLAGVEHTLASGTLRRIGLRDEMAELLAGVEHTLASGTTHQRARLALAGGLAFLGDTARALPILEQARKALGEQMLLNNRLELTRALAQAYSYAPFGNAFAGVLELSNQLPGITDSFGTNSHYCLSVLHFVESLLTGLVSDHGARGAVSWEWVPVTSAVAPVSAATPPPREAAPREAAALVSPVHVVEVAVGSELAALEDALEGLADRILMTRRERSPVEAPAELTGAYVTLQLAYGFARIGRSERARLLVAQARVALEGVIADPVHAYLAAAFEARVEQAIAGQPPETPLPEPVVTSLAGLSRAVRCKILPLLEVSRILEPMSRFGVFRNMQANGDKPDVLNSCLGVMPELVGPEALLFVTAAVPLIKQGLLDEWGGVLYAVAIAVASDLGHNDLATQLLDSLANAISVSRGDQSARVLDQGLRALHRFGAHRAILELLAQIEHALPPERSHLFARIALASGLASLGDTARALPILDRARYALGEAMPMADRLALTRAIAQAYSYVPLGHALGAIRKLSAQLGDITDSGDVNSHYCLSVLHFVESLVTGIVSAGDSPRMANT